MKLIFLFILFLVSVNPVGADVVWDIRDFKVIEPLPSNIVAGSEYNTTYSFKNDKQIPFQVVFNISSGSGEWVVKMNLDNNRTEMIEYDKGRFVGNLSNLDAGSHILGVSFGSRPYIKPGNYTIEFRIYSSYDEIVYQQRIGSSRKKSIIDVSPTPKTPEIVIISALDSHEDGIDNKSNDDIEFTAYQMQSYISSVMLSVFGVFLGAGVLLYLKRDKVVEFLIKKGVLKEYYEIVKQP